MMALKDFASVVAVVLALGGLVWQGAEMATTQRQQGTRNDEQDIRIERIETRQATDHDVLTGVAKDIHYIAEKLGKREAE